MATADHADISSAVEGKVSDWKPRHGARVGSNAPRLESRAFVRARARRVLLRPDSGRGAGAAAELSERGREADLRMRGRCDRHAGAESGAGTGGRAAGRVHRRSIGWVDDPEAYPIQPKKTSFEYLREVAHLRPRTNTLGAVARVRHCLSMAIHRYFHEHGFFWIHTPIITASDAEGAGEMFRVSTLDLANLAAVPRTPTAGPISARTSSARRRS